MALILVIEDEGALRQDIETILKLEGFQTLTAADGLKGLQAAREHLPDLIICDIMMPYLNGYDLLEKLQRDSTTFAIPFIFLTAKTGQEDFRRGMQLGADDYLIKPFKHQDLLAAIRTRLDRKQTLEKQQLIMFSRRLVQAQEIERRRLAHMLSEDIAGKLLDLKFVLEMTTRVPDEIIRASLNGTADVVDTLIHTLKLMAYDLHPTILDHLGLIPVLPEYFERYARQSGVKVDFTHSGSVKRLLPMIEIASYRIIQEALDNVASYAGVQEVRVEVKNETERLEIEITDKGYGFNLDTILNTHTAGGLIRIREQTYANNGTVQINSAPGQGTCLKVVFPLSGQTPQTGNGLSRLTDISQDFHDSMRVMTAQSPEKSDTALSEGSGIKILLAHHHDLVRQGLQNLLGIERDFHLVGEVTDGAKIAEAVRTLQPDILIFSPQMPHMDDRLSFVREIQEMGSPVRLIMLDIHADKAYVRDIQEKGIQGYVLKEAIVSNLVLAVRAVMAGKNYASQPAQHQDTESPETDEAYETLTNREREVFKLLAEGYKNIEIADMLVISHRTVETHRANVMRKLELENVADIVKYAIRLGIISIAAR